MKNNNHLLLFVNRSIQYIPVKNSRQSVKLESYIYYYYYIGIRIIYVKVSTIVEQTKLCNKLVGIARQRESHSRREMNQRLKAN